MKNIKSQIKISVKSLSNGINQRENRVSEPEDKVEEQEQFNKNEENKLLGEFSDIHDTL